MQKHFHDDTVSTSSSSHLNVSLFSQTPVIYVFRFGFIQPQKNQECHISKIKLFFDACVSFFSFLVSSDTFPLLSDSQGDGVVVDRRQSVRWSDSSLRTPYDTIRYHTIPYNTIQYHTLPYNATQYHTIPCNTIQYHTVPHNTTEYHTIPYDTM